MASRDPEPALTDREGTSQQGRHLAALDPEHVLVDERSATDLLAFARQYGAELKYFAADNTESGDWGSFVGASLDLDEVAAFMDHPERFSPERSPLLFRPHFVLFLTFLRLVRSAQRDLNSFGRRHLDFYFREFLGLRGKPARPDRVNLLFDLVPAVDQAGLAAGSLLTAGPDSLGKERIYSTDRAVVISRAQVKKLSSVHVERRIVALQGARDNNKNDHQQAAVEMLEIALGMPEPGDPLPHYPDRGSFDFDRLNGLADIVGFAQTDLHLRMFELRELMDLLRHRRAHAEDEWERINELLREAGQPDRQLTADLTSRDFDGLIAAMGEEPPYGQLSEINNVYDLFDQRTTTFDRRTTTVDERIDTDARRFIEDHFFEYDRFVEIMLIKVRIDAEWDGINRILQTAGQRQRGDADYRLPVIEASYEQRREADGPPPILEASDFDTNLNTALEGLDFSGLDGVESLEDYDAAVREAEGYFFMSAEELTYVLPRLSAGEHDSKLDAILVGAHRQMRHATRRLRLQTIREASGFTAMIRYALNEDPAGAADAAALERLEPFLAEASDLRQLEGMSHEPASANAAEWQSVYRTVEIAQWNREGRVDYVPRKEQWLNIHPAVDATMQATESPTQGDEAAQWHTLGASDVRAAGDPPAPVLGWACSSPLLALSAGTRVIELTLRFDARGFERKELEDLVAGDPLRDGSPFRFQVTTKTGWIEPDSVELALGTYSELKSGISPDGGDAIDALHVELTFSKEADALAAAPADLAGIDSGWPVLRLMLGQVWQAELKRYVTSAYPVLRTLSLSTVHIRVSVTGLQPSHLQNDETIFDPKKPFEPFGSSPAAGSRLLIGHPEVVAKRLQSLTYRIEWMGKPSDLEDAEAGHYRNYGEEKLSFTAALGLVDRQVERVLKAAAELFDSGASQSDDLAAMRIDEVSAAVALRHSATPQPDSSSSDLHQWDRYLQWTLNKPDFQHQAYPAVASRMALKMAADIANDEPTVITAANYEVSPPYTPKIKTLMIDYAAELEVDLGAAPEQGSSRDAMYQILHVHPFGTCDANAERTSDRLPFVPRYENEGELYVGLRDLDSPQTLSLLFQMAEGSADPDVATETVNWSILSGDRWIPISDRDVLIDTTRGLRNTGIVELSLKRAEPNRRLAPGLYWLRASIARNSASICDAVAIHAQAVSATFTDDQNAPDHYATPLPPGSVTKLVEADPRIASVRQPYTSQGGRMAEAAGVFNTRVSERLRHKERAVTVWDYERLVLEHFPEIYKVKCIPASAARGADHLGTVQVVVIPDIRDKLPFNPYGPKAPADLLADIREYLAARTPLPAAVEVINPRYVAVKVRMGVRFKAGGNDDYRKQLLTDELNRFLSPWAYEEGAEIVISGKIYANSIIDFLDRRPYVDYIADIRLFTSDDGEDFLQVTREPDKSYFVTAGRPDGVLVAARTHDIDLIPETGYRRELVTGIGFMKVELDLRVAEFPSPS